jgi:sugar lactone lactonase YvrE
MMSRIAALLSIALLTGCGGGSSTLPSSTLASSPHASIITLRIDQPAASSSSFRRRPQYVSPATESLVYVITGPGSAGTVIGSGYVNLTPGSTYCTSSGALQPLTCTTQFALPFPSTGNYTFNVATYDAQQTAQCTPGTTGATACAGNLLSDQDVAQTLTLGTNNVLTLVLGGVATSISLGPLTPGYIKGDAHGLTLWGATAEKVTVEPLDADGNPIVGLGAPSIAVTSSAATLKVTTAPTASAPNLFALQAKTSGTPAAVTPGVVNVSVALTAPASGGGNAATFTVPVTIAHSIVYVATEQATSTVYGFYDGNTNGTKPNITITNDVGDPFGVAVDANGALYVSDSDLSYISVYPSGSTTQSYVLNNAVNSPQGVAVDQGGNLYVANNGANNVTEYAQGARTGAPFATFSVTAPYGLAVDGSGNLYVGSQNAAHTAYQIAMFPAGSPDGASPSFVITSGVNYPSQLAFDGSGNLYVADTTKVEEYFAPLSASSTVGNTITTLATPYGVAVDAAGTIYACNDSSPGSVDLFAPGSTGAATPTAQISIKYAAALAVVPAAVQP